jgi:serine/threonine protein kinase/Tol biopolymer transport system component
MSLPPGTRLGPYELTGQIGAGGMGEVYRAHDTNLRRDVAVKVLPASVSADAERLARFRREAQVLATLNHPNIAAIYGIEESGTAPALVMELVEGEDLSTAIARASRADGPVSGSQSGRHLRGIPLEDALPIARQIVDALGAAHAQGVIHRDLKPANIKLKGTSVDLAGATVKVLDFGLAKLADPGAIRSGSSDIDPANSPTITSPAMTAMGMILGTAAYMAPEQARGRVVDKRADIWAFGCVLYEMLTGRRAFEGDDVSDTLATILKSDPDWTALPAGTPLAIRRLLRRCLTKDPARRLADIADARLDLDDPATSSGDETNAAPAVEPFIRRRWIERIGLLVAGIAVAAIGLGPWVVSHLRETPPAPLPTLRVPLLPPEGLRVEPGFVISPDGRYVAFRASRRGEQVRLWIRDLATMDVRVVAGTDDAFVPVWSPDSRSVAYADLSGIKLVDVAAGSVRMLIDRAGPSIAWAPDGTIVFNRAAAPGAAGEILWRLPLTGGEPVALTTLDTGAGDTDHAVQQFLPDGRRFLFTAAPGNRLYVGHLDGTSPTLLAEQIWQPSYAAPGYLLYLREGTLFVQRFDTEIGLLVGEPAPFIGQVSALFSVGKGDFSVSNNGVLIYTQGTAARGGLPVWVDRQGRESPVPGLAASQALEFPRISPDGRRVAFVSSGDLWIGDLGGRPPIRLTFDGARAPVFTPLWTPDGQRLVIERGGSEPGLWSVAADGRDATPERVLTDGHHHAHAWSADGRELIAARLSGAESDIVALPYPTPGESRSVVATPAWEGVAGLSMSPDGRWLAYAANPTGRMEIYVRPYSGSGAAVRVSPDGGTEPEWSRDGRELFYRERERLLSARVTRSGSDNDIQFDLPIVLFESDYVRGDFYQPPSYDVAPDGRFLLLKWPAGSAPGERPPVLFSNWIAEFEREHAAPGQ